MPHSVDDDAGVSRRSMLKRGAAVGVAAAWTVPVIQVVSMTSAHADSPSSPPNTPPPDQPTPISSPTSATATPTPTTSSSAPTPGGSSTTTPAAAATSNATQGTPSVVTRGSGSLANTGVSLPVGPTIGAGVAAIALGAGLVTMASSRPADEPEEPAGA